MSLNRWKRVAALLPLLVLAAGCEGDAGPAGPQGPPGPSTILAFGTIENSPTTSVVRDVSPTSVTAATARLSTGLFQVTLTGNFPPGEPVLIVAGGSGAGGATNVLARGDLDCYYGNNVGADCAANEIVFEVYVFGSGDAALDEGFSFVVLGQ